jgi:hypothetical protein
MFMVPQVVVRHQQADRSQAVCSEVVSWSPLSEEDEANVLFLRWHSYVWGGRG